MSINNNLKGNSHQIILSEMGLPGIEVLIEKLLPKILGRLGKENPSKKTMRSRLCARKCKILGRLGKENPAKKRCEVAIAQCKCAVTSSVWYDFYTLRTCTTNQAKISACMQGSREWCPVCVGIPELFVRVSTAVQYATKCCVTSHDTSTGFLGTFQALNILVGEGTRKIFPE